MGSLTVTLTDTDLSTLDDFIGSSKFSDRSETVKLAIRHLYTKSRSGTRRGNMVQKLRLPKERGKPSSQKSGRYAKIPPQDMKIDESVS